MMTHVCLFIVTVYQVSEQKFILYCLYFDNTPDITCILILMFQLRILRGKQHLERKLFRDIQQYSAMFHHVEGH